jgi:hypothetical protein
MTQIRWTTCAALLGLTVVLSAPPAFAKGFRVGPTRDITSIQEAVDMASDGDKIVVDPGTYTEPDNGTDVAVLITKSLKMIGKSKKGDPSKQVIIVPNAGQEHGILAEGTDGDHIDGLRIKGFTVQGFSGNGIWTRYVDNFKIDKNTSIDNAENGIWPTLSAHGKVLKNVSYGSDDSALWVEAATDVRVMKNELHDSVTGLEVTISADVEMKKNEVYNNTVGVGLYHPNGAGMEAPPGLLTTTNWELKANNIYDNNRVNTAPPSSLPGQLPPGGGILVLGIDNVTGEKNQIEDNDFYGVAIVDYCAAVGGGPTDCALIPPIVEGMPELNRFEKNTFVNNGTAPPPHPLDPYAADVTYLLLDIFNNGEYSGPYLSNTVCGSGKPNIDYTTNGLSTGFQIIIREKC